MGDLPRVWGTPLGLSHWILGVWGGGKVGVGPNGVWDVTRWFWGCSGMLGGGHWVWGPPRIRGAPADSRRDFWDPPV